MSDRLLVSDASGASLLHMVLLPAGLEGGVGAIIVILVYTTITITITITIIIIITITNTIIITITTPTNDLSLFSFVCPQQCSVHNDGYK